MKKKTIQKSTHMDHVYGFTRNLGSSEKLQFTLSIRKLWVVNTTFTAFIDYPPEF